MTRVLDRQKAVVFRKQGKTYSEIKQSLGVSKSTLSYWLSNYPLTSGQLRKLKEKIKNKKYLAIEKTRLTKLQKRDMRLKDTYQEEKRKWLPLSKRELFIAGLFLYWGEGIKNIKAAIGVNNTDPSVVKFYLYWLTKVLEVPKQKLRVYVHLYNDMTINTELKFWSKELKIPESQFIKPYIKPSSRINIEHKGFGHGTCGIYVQDVRLKEKIIKAIEAISDYYVGEI